MPYRNLDEFLIRLEHAGDLIHLNEPPPPTSKALWIEEENQQFPVILNIFGTHQRMAWALGLDDLEALNTRLSKLLDLQLPQGMSGIMSRASDLITIVRSVNSSIIHNAPVQQHQVSDLTALPRRHVTMAQVVTVQGNSQKVISADLEIMDAHTVRLPAIHLDTTDQHQPIAMVIGGDPATMWAAIAPLPNGFDPYLLAGWLRGKPVPMTKTLTQPLRVPADAEIIIEGELQTTNDGYAYIHVTGITHREGAVFPVVCIQNATQEAVWLYKAVERLFMPLLKMVMDEVVDLNLPTEYGLHNLALLSINKRHNGQPYKVMHGIWGMSKLALTRVVVIVDADVDVQNVGAVAQRLLETVDFRRDMLTSFGMTHDPRQPEALGSKVGIDATRKSDASPQSVIDVSGLELTSAWRLFERVLVVQASDDDAQTLIQAVWQYAPRLHVVIVDDRVDLNDQDGLFRWLLAHLPIDDFQINDAGAVAMICS